MCITQIMAKMILHMEKTLIESFEAGYNCEMKGPDSVNCHYSFFATKLQMEAWQHGKRIAKAHKAAAADESKRE